MGLMQFLVHDTSRLSADVLERIYFAGLDQVPWPVRVRRTPVGLSIERDGSESGNLRVPWAVEGRGELMLGTASLMERAAPYQLEVELARGYLNQVRGALADWQAIGLGPPAPLTAALGTALRAFAEAATRQHDPPSAAQAAERALAATSAASRLLIEAYAEQALAVRHRMSSKLDVEFGCGLGNALPEGESVRNLGEVCHQAILPCAWPQVESTEGNRDWLLVDAQIAWCRAHRLRVVAGPLVAFDRVGLPDWLCLWAGDLTSLSSFVREYVREAVTRYRGQVDQWIGWSRPYAMNGLDLSEEDTLRLAVQVVETLRTVDGKTPLCVSFDQPWAEHMGRSEYDLSPWHLADALVRSELGLTSIRLEFNVGYQPGVTQRDVVDVGRQLDLWSQLGLPLDVQLAAPAAVGDDPLARGVARVAGRAGMDPWTPAAQASWARERIPFFLAKPYVRSVAWSQLSDATIHDLPFAGMFDAGHRAREVREVFRELRLAHLA